MTRIKIERIMKKKLLIYRWGSLSEPLLCETIKSLNWPYIEFARKMNNYHADAEFARELIQVIHREGVEEVFSYDYFPLISMVCEINAIPYVSWIYDCPQYTLLSKTLTNPCNYIFCFDRLYAEQLQKMGAVHCCHYPLAGSNAYGACAFQEDARAHVSDYSCDISFVGNLYNEKKNRLRQITLSDYAAGFVEGLIEAQLLIYGQNFVKASLTKAVTEEILEKCELTLGNEYMQDPLQLATDAINMEISCRERELVIETISSRRKIRLYTSSELPGRLSNANVQKMGYADYEKEVPHIFHDSRINLNITSKTIESGIPQRVFDILSCGGFCLTNYQPEIAEYFADGEELVMYTGMEDLLEKVEYYLAHEEERKRIAEKGHEKILREFELTQRVMGMLESVM